MPRPDTESPEHPRRRGIDENGNEFPESRNHYYKYLTDYRSRQKAGTVTGNPTSPETATKDREINIPLPGAPGVPVEPPRLYTPIGGTPLPIPDPGAFSSSPYYNPYAGSGSAAFGKERNIGGDQDFLPTIAARGIGLNVLQDLLRSNPMEYAANQRQALGQMNNGIPGFGDSLSREAMQSLLPSLQSDALTQDQGMHTKLRNLLTSSYGQGGAIRGNELANTGNWEEYKRAKKLGATSVGSSSGPSGGGNPLAPFSGGVPAFVSR